MPTHDDTKKLKDEEEEDDEENTEFFDIVDQEFNELFQDDDDDVKNDILSNSHSSSTINNTDSHDSKTHSGQYHTTLVKGLVHAMNECHIVGNIDIHTGEPLTVEKQQRRIIIGHHIIVYACTLIGKINHLVSLFSTFYVIRQVSLGQDISPLITDPLFWAWCQELVTTLNGKHKGFDKKISRNHEKLGNHHPVTAQKRTRKKSTIANQKSHKNATKTSSNSNRKRKRTQHNDDDSNRKVKLTNSQPKPKPTIHEKATVENNSLQSLRDAFQQFKKLIDEKSFIWPDRQHITKILSYEKNNCKTNFLMLYKPKLLKSRMERVILLQVSELLYDFKSCFGEKSPIKHQIKNIIYKLVTGTTTFQLKNGATYNMCKQEWYIELLKHHLYGSVIAPIIEEIRVWHTRRMSNSDTIKWYDSTSIKDNITQIIPYVAQLWSYSKHSISEFKPKQFPAMPQVKKYIPFIEINPDGLGNLIGLSTTAAWQQWVTQHFPQYASHCTLDWITLDRDWYMFEDYADDEKSLDEMVKDQTMQPQPWLRKFGEHHMSRLIHFPQSINFQYTTTIQTNGQEVHFQRIRLKNKPSRKKRSTMPPTLPKQQKLVQDQSTIHDLYIDDDIKIEEEEETEQTKRFKHRTTARHGLLGSEEDLIKLYQDVTNHSGIYNKLVGSIDPGIINLISMVLQPFLTREQECRQRLQRTILYRRQQEHQNEKMLYDEKSNIEEEQHQQKLSKNQKRKAAKNQRLFVTNQEEYELTNKRFHDLCGYTTQRKRLQYWKEQDGIFELDKKLGQAQCKTFDLEMYKKYIMISLETDLYNRYWKFVEKPCHRKLRFSIYQRKQRALYKVAREMCCWRGKQLPFGMFVFLWGNGSFKSSTKGRCSASNKGLRKGLSQWLDIYIVNEDNTSKRTACCQSMSVFPTISRQHLPKATNQKHQVKLDRRIGKKHRDLLYCIHDCHKEKNHGLVNVTSNNHDTNGQSCYLQLVDGHSDPSTSKSRPWKRDMSGARGIYVGFRDRVCYYNGETPSWQKRCRK